MHCATNCQPLSSRLDSGSKTRKSLEGNHRGKPNANKQVSAMGSRAPIVKSLRYHARDFLHKASPCHSLSRTKKHVFDWRTITGSLVLGPQFSYFLFKKILEIKTSYQLLKVPKMSSHFFQYKLKKLVIPVHKHIILDCSFQRLSHRDFVENFGWQKHYKVMFFLLNHHQQSLFSHY